MISFNQKLTKSGLRNLLASLRWGSKLGFVKKKVKVFKGGGGILLAVA